MMRWKQATNDSYLNQSLMFPSNVLNYHFNLDFWQFWAQQSNTFLIVLALAN